MPRKDGTPTAKERADAERIAANHRWIAEASPEMLADMRRTMAPGDEWVDLIDAELDERGLWECEHCGRVVPFAETSEGMCSICPDGPISDAERIERRRNEIVENASTKGHGRLAR